MALAAPTHASSLNDTAGGGSWTAWETHSGAASDLDVGMAMTSPDDTAAPIDLETQQGGVQPADVASVDPLPAPPPPRMRVASLQVSHPARVIPVAVITADIKPETDHVVLRTDHLWIIGSFR